MRCAGGISIWPERLGICCCSLSFPPQSVPGPDLGEPGNAGERGGCVPNRVREHAAGAIALLPGLRRCGSAMQGSLAARTCLPAMWLVPTFERRAPTGCTRPQHAAARRQACPARPSQHWGRSAAAAAAAATSPPSAAAASPAAQELHRPGDTMKHAPALAMLAALAIRRASQPCRPPAACPAAACPALPLPPAGAPTVGPLSLHLPSPASSCVAAGSTTPPSYVVSVAHQSAGSQPYPRGCNNRGITIAVGAGSAAVTCERRPLPARFGGTPRRMAWAAVWRWNEAQPPVHAPA